MRLAKNCLWGLPVVLFFLTGMAWAQNIPIGAWRSHISYNEIHSIAVSSVNVFAAASNGIVIVNKADEQISVLNKLNGLTTAGITSIAFDQNQKQLLIAYEDGNLDLVSSSGVVNYNQLKNSPTISGSKKINSISIKDNLAYLAADYGVVVFDLLLNEVKETFRDLAADGSNLRINKSTFRGDSIFLATASGVLAGDLRDNLLDFNKWKRFNTGVFSGNIQSITTFNGDIYVAIDNAGVYRYSSGNWTLAYLAGEKFKDLTSPGNVLFVTTSFDVWEATIANGINKLNDGLITSPSTAFQDGNVKWIGDGGNGLIKINGGASNQFIPNGPSFSKGHRLTSSGLSIFNMSGGLLPNGAPAGNSAYLNEFVNGSWNLKQDFISNDIMDAKVLGGNLFIATYGHGLQVISKDGVATLYNETNSPLQNISPGNNVRITALTGYQNEMWVANYGATQSLHVLVDGAWQSFSFPIFASRFIRDMITDAFGNVWMVLDVNQGGGILVFKKSTNQYVYLTETANAGGLPSRSAYSLARDREGQIWVGTAQGVAYFPNPGGVFSGSVNAIKPIFSNRFLLRDEKITSIAVDGGNRKWIGTEHGVWLFNSFGEELVQNFTETTSPILSDSIADIEINSTTGEVFIMSSKGLVSFRSDATASSNSFKQVKIFPNPITRSFNGLVGISGLATDAVVKITDVSGKLIWQTQANGGTVSWNVRDYTGRRASTGIYLVFSITADGGDGMVGKIAVID